MKQLVFITIITVLSCKAQTIIVPIGSGDDIQLNTNYYHKDVNNEFGRFEGTWLYTDGNTELIFKLKKEELYQISSDSHYEDLLVGEYQYIENGVEKANTLADFDNASISGYDHYISSTQITWPLYR